MKADKTKLTRSAKPLIVKDEKMNTSTIPQVAITTDKMNWKIKRDMQIVNAFRRLYDEMATNDDMAARIKRELKLDMTASSVKSLISNLRSEGVPLPKCARKSRNGGEPAFSEEQRLKYLMEAWNSTPIGLENVPAE